MTLGPLKAPFLASKLHCRDENHMGSLFIMQVILLCRNAYTITIPIDPTLNKSEALIALTDHSLQLLVLLKDCFRNKFRRKRETVPHTHSSFLIDEILHILSLNIVCS